MAKNFITKWIGKKRASYISRLRKSHSSKGAGYGGIQYGASLKHKK